MEVYCFYLFQLISVQELNGTIVDSELLKYLTDEISQPLNSKVIPLNERKKEKWYLKLVQIVIPFFIAGFGMVGAGLLLAVVSVCISHLACFAYFFTKYFLRNGMFL